MTNHDKSVTRMRIMLGVLIFLALFSCAILTAHANGIDIMGLGTLITALFTFSATVLSANLFSPAGGWGSDK